MDLNNRSRLGRTTTTIALASYRYSGASAMYSGAIENGQMHGPGRLQYANGDVFEVRRDARLRLPSAARSPPSLTLALAPRPVLRARREPGCTVSATATALTPTTTEASTRASGSTTRCAHPQQGCTARAAAAAAVELRIARPGGNSGRSASLASAAQASNTPVPRTRRSTARAPASTPSATR